jgi:alkaline phosphatase
MGVPDIARQLVAPRSGDGLEVALGGGRRAFLPKTTVDPEYADQAGNRVDGRDLTQEWLDRHPRSAYVWNGAQLAALDLTETDHLLGLFEPSHMKFELDRSGDAAGEPSLAELTKVALDVLRRSEDGFFLMVEGGRIDHGHHAGNAHRALHDALAFDDAVAMAMTETSPEDTLIVVTADHSHTLTIGGYPTRGNPIFGLVRSNDPQGRPQDSPMLDAFGLPFTTLGYANGPGHLGASGLQPEGPKRFPHFMRAVEASSAGRHPLSDEQAQDPAYLQEVGIPLSAETHAGEDVAILAGGAGAELFHGVQEQNFIYHAIVEALGWSD